MRIILKVKEAGDVDDCETGDENVEAALSAMSARWELAEYDERLKQTLAQRYGVPDIVAHLLAVRGVSVDEAAGFLSPTIRGMLPDPMHLRDMGKAVERAVEAIARGENIVVFGDYDVDGATSSALLKRFFDMAGAGDVRIYIPDRIDEGYGPSADAMRALKGDGADLVITVDCGTVSFEPLQVARDIGLDAIVMDHHMGAPELPKAVAVVNPSRYDETSEYRHLAAVGLCFLYAVAINKALREKGWYDVGRKEPDLMSLLDLVALGTVCDVMRLSDINRAYVTQGLKIMARRGNVGLRTLLDRANVESLPTAYHMGFVIGPRINAGGRIGKADLGAQLLTTEDEARAHEIIDELETLNSERQALEALMLEEALAQVEEREMYNNPILLVEQNGWHQGVVGIVASRLKDKYNLPTAVITWNEEGRGKASARSVKGVDLGAAVASARRDGMIIEGGGHAMAAGFSLMRGQFAEFAQYMYDMLRDPVEMYKQRRSYTIDSFVSLGAITQSTAKDIEQLAPFGSGNPQPKFAIKQVRIVKMDIIREQHIQVILAEGGAFATRLTKRATAFRATGTPLEDFLRDAYEDGREVDVTGNIRANMWKGSLRVSFSIDDARLHQDATPAA